MTRVLGVRDGALSGITRGGKLMRTQAHPFRCLVTCLAAILMLVGPLFSVQAVASSVDVFVGYADNLRASPFFPSPFFGDPTVDLFAGQNPNLFQLDAGAIRILNTGGSTISIDSLSVALHP